MDNKNYANSWEELEAVYEREGYPVVATTGLEALKDYYEWLKNKGYPVAVAAGPEALKDYYEWIENYGKTKREND